MVRKIDAPPRTGKRYAPRSESLKQVPSPKMESKGFAKFQATLLVGLLCLGLGYLLERLLAPAVQAKMLPWALGRSLGLAAMIELWALVLVGLWFKSPYAKRFRVMPPAQVLRLHQALTSSGAVVLTLHIVALLIDRYAGVGVLGAFIPGLSGYRRLGVAFGTIALYLGILIGGSAALSGLIVGRRWLSVHKLALLMFASAWLHGLTSGTDADVLRPLYLLFGVTVGILYLLSRKAASS